MKVGRMKVAEFESFLEQLQQQLRLSDQEDQAIVEELREHLSDQFEQLLRSGWEHQQAVQQCLADLGASDLLAKDLQQANRWTQRQARQQWYWVAAICGLLIAVGVYRAWPAQTDFRWTLPGLSGHAPPSQPVPVTAAVLDQRLIQKLEQPIGYRTQEGLPLEEFLEQMQRVHQIQSHVADRELGFSEDSRTRLASWDYPEIRLRTVLSLVLGQQDLTYSLQSGVLIIHLSEYQDRYLVSRTYPLSLPDHQWKHLKEVIPQCIAPDRWQEKQNRQLGVLKQLGQRLVVYNSWPVQEEVHQLLVELDLIAESTAPSASNAAAVPTP